MDGDGDQCGGIWDPQEFLMAALFCESFDHYATAEFTTKWSAIGTSPDSTPTISSGNGRRSSQSAQWALPNNGNEGKVLYKSVNASGSTAVVGFAFKQGNLGFSVLTSSSINDNPEYASSFIEGANGLLYIINNATTQVFFNLNNTGTISAYRSSTLLGTSTATLTVDSWAYLEFKVVIHNTAGTIDVMKDGSNILSLSGINTRNDSVTTWTKIAIGHPSRSSASGTLYWDYDDLYVCDGSGSLNNDFLGDVRIDPLLPSGAGTYAEWTPSTGSNYQNVDETLTDGDTTYNETSTVNNRDSHTYSNCPVADSAIFFVQSNMMAKKTDAGTVGISPTARISSVDCVGAEQFVSSSYVDMLTVWEQTPEGSPQTWTTTIIDAAEFGYKKTT